jgi:hypothetical protein
LSVLPWQFTCELLISCFYLTTIISAISVAVSEKVSDGSDYVVHAASRRVHPRSHRPKNSANWPNSSHLHRTQDEKPGSTRLHPKNDSRSSQPRSKFDGFFNGIGSIRPFAAPIPEDCFSQFA